MARLGVAHVPEGRGTFASLSVLDNLRVGAWVQRGASGRDLARVFELFPVLYERRDQRAGTLSGGEQQMLALGRAMMARPRLLLLDEPSLGLAPLVTREVFSTLQHLNEQGTAIVVVEQNAALALSVARRAYLLETARWCSPARLRRFAQTKTCGGAISATDGELLAAGGVGSCVGRDLRLARACACADLPRDGRDQLRAGRTGDALGIHLRGAFGHGWSFWPAFAATVVVSFAGGMALHATVIRPLQSGPLLGIVIVTIGLLIAVNGLDTWIWDGAVRQFQGPFSTSPIRVGGVAFSKQDLGVIVVSLVAVAAVGLLLSRTKLGLGLRRGGEPGRVAARGRARRRHVRVRLGDRGGARRGRRRDGGAVAAARAEHDADRSAYAFAAALVGAMTSPLGAVLGGLGLGVLLNLLGTYVSWIGGDLRLAAALALILALLLVRRRA